MQLTRYEAARAALVEVRSIDEVKEIHDEAAAMQEYARRAKDPELIEHATEIRLCARRALGLRMEAQKAAGLMAKGAKAVPGVKGFNGGVSETPPLDKPITLAEAGIDKNLAKRARNEAAKSEEEFQQYLLKAKQKQRDAIEGNKVNRTSFTADNEWFTPPEYLEIARKVLGDIDLDPASHPAGQKTIQAKRFFTLKDDGLTKEWSDRVWLNPPYAQPAIGDFVEKLVSGVAAKRVTAVILLTHNYTDTGWFHKAAGAAQAICFTRGRIRFIALDGGIAAPTQGQAFFYFGSNGINRFISAFKEVGLVVRLRRAPKRKPAPERPSAG